MKDLFRSHQNPGKKSDSRYVEIMVKEFIGGLDVVHEKATREMELPFVQMEKTF
jgi:hypothetical protein